MSKLTIQVTHPDREVREDVIHALNAILGKMLFPMRERREDLNESPPGYDLHMLYGKGGPVLRSEPAVEVVDNGVTLTATAERP